jgi:hypothetical protein
MNADYGRPVIFRIFDGELSEEMMGTYKQPIGDGFQTMVERDDGQICLPPTVQIKFTDKTPNNT